MKKCDRSTNALLVGSSIPMCAAACSDEGIAKKVFHVDYDLFCYSKAENLSRAISHALNKEIKLFNFSGNGCMISDAKRIIDEALLLKPNFSLLVLAIAPRDFIDNTASPVDKTEYSRFFDSQNAHPKYASVSQNLDAWAKKSSYFYYTRSDYRFLLTALTTSIFKRGKDLYDATHFANDDNLFQISKLEKNNKLANSSATREILDKDLSQYKKRYLPIDQTRYTKEFESLQAILREAKDKKLQVILIDMPLTEANLNLLPIDFRVQHKERLQRLVSQFSNSKYMDLNQSTGFRDADFRDSAHLNGGGSNRFIEQVKKHLSN